MTETLARQSNGDEVYRAAKVKCALNAAKDAIGHDPRALRLLGDLISREAKDAQDKIDRASDKARKAAASIRVEYGLAS